MTNLKLKIFVSAYACEPNLGSEIGVGWHWVLEMSKHFDLWVLTRKSNRENIKGWIVENPEYESIKFIYFDLPYYLRFWKKGMRGVRTYYNIWQWCTNSIVKNTMQANNIEIFHHLTYGNALWAISSYGKKQFFIWGPQGGTETVSSEYSKHYNLKSRIIELIRRFVVVSLPINLAYRRRFRHSNLILSKTAIHQKNIPHKYRDKSVIFTDVAVDSFNVQEIENRKNDIFTNYIVVGRLDAWRGFDILVEAFAISVKKNSKVKLKIIGDGTDKKRIIKLIKKLDLEQHVVMLGKVNISEYKELMINSDVVINPCLKEGAVTTSFDAMAMGKPIICIDTTGYTRYFSSENAVLIPLVEREKVISDLSKAILDLTNQAVRYQLGQNSKFLGKNFTWKARGEEVFHLIREKYLLFKENN